MMMLPRKDAALKRRVAQSSSLGEFDRKGFEEGY
jgi:hypothetical protein